MLKVNDLQKLYDNGFGIKNISFEIDKGEIVGLVGANGAGKTTMLKCLMQLIDYNGVFKINDKIISNSTFPPIKVGSMLDNSSKITS